MKLNLAAEVVAQPFEVSESGWGEFEVLISIHMHDTKLDPVQVVHKLKLYPPAGIVASLERPVIDEVYDEIVFNELPKDARLRKLLLSGKYQCLRIVC